MSKLKTKKARALYCTEYKGIVEFDSDAKLTMEDRTKLVVAFLEKTPTLWVDGMHLPTDYVVEIVEKALDDVYWDEEWHLGS